MVVVELALLAGLVALVPVLLQLPALLVVVERALVAVLLFPEQVVLALLVH